MQRPWLTLVPQGIPAEVDYTAYNSLKEILETELRAVRRPSRVREHGRDRSPTASSTS